MSSELAYHQFLINLDSFVGGGCNGILMRVRKLKEIKILFKSRWYNIRYYTLLSPNFEQRFRVDWEWVVDQQMSGISWRTKVRRISFLLGLLEARTIRLSFSFLNAGVRRAWSSICRDIVRVRSTALCLFAIACFSKCKLWLLLCEHRPGFREFRVLWRV